MNELSKQLKCICLRNGVELWIESERIDKINLENSGRFLKIGEEIINTADIVGIFTAQAMEDKTRRQNGEWQCRQGEWHSKKDKCECVDKNLIRQKIKEAELYYDQYGAWPLWYKAEWREKIK